MNTLFGVSTTNLLVGLLGVFGLVLLVLIVSALRNRVAFRLAVRNIPRRPGQTTLILLGLMLATLLSSASFSTGDTMTHSLRLQAVRDLGEVDLIVQAEQGDALGRPSFFEEQRAAEVAAVVAGSETVDGSAALIRETAPASSPESGLSEPAVDVLGMPVDRPASLGALVDAQGAPLDLVGLQAGEVFLSQTVAANLELGPGDRIQAFFSAQPEDLTVAAVFASGAEPGGQTAMVLPLEELQTLLGRTGEINTIVVSNVGTGPDAAAGSDAMIAELEPVLAGAGLEATAVRQDRLNEAEELGNFFSSIFLLFAQSRWRRAYSDLPDLRDVGGGAQARAGHGAGGRSPAGHVVRMFVYEGFLYALLASAVGSVLGVVVGWGMVRVIRVAIESADFDLTFTFNWRSVLIAYLLGTVFTFVVVLISSWRVSRLNIVRAVRDLPEPRVVRRTRKRLVGIVLLLAAGVAAFVGGLQSLQSGTTSLGVSLFIIGLALLARRLGVSERLAFSVAGLTLVVWWVLPSSVVDLFLPEMQAGIELFFLSGIMLVIGGVWVVIFNTDIILRVVVAVLGRVRGLSAVLKVAVTYPTLERFRTGMTLAMLSLVVFTLVIMSFIIASIGMVFEDEARLSGGYDLRVSVGYANPIDNLPAAWEAQSAELGMRPEDLATVAGLTAASTRVSQVGTDQEPGELFVQGVDRMYAESTSYGFALTAPDYPTARDVWIALMEEPDTAVVASYLVPTKSDFSFSSNTPPVTLEGFWLQDDSLPEVYLSMASPAGGAPRRLRVIGVLDSMAVYLGGVVTSRDTLEAVAGEELPTFAYMIGLAPGVDPAPAARALEKAFVSNGLQAEPVGAEIREMTRSSLMVNTLLQWFMALGLVVGIAALGVIAARSVVERRRQIGVLRALGFQPAMVQLAFLLESTFVSVLGIGLGVLLAVALSPGVD